MSQPTQNMSVAEAALLLNCHRQWVNTLIDSGKLKAEKVGRAYVLRASAVEAYRQAELAKARKVGFLRFDHNLDVDTVEAFLAACLARGESVETAAARALAAETKRMTAAR